MSLFSSRGRKLEIQPNLSRLVILSPPTGFLVAANPKKRFPSLAKNFSALRSLANTVSRGSLSRRAFTALRSGCQGVGRSIIRGGQPGCGFPDRPGLRHVCSLSWYSCSYVPAALGPFEYHTRLPAGDRKEVAQRVATGGLGDPSVQSGCLHGTLRHRFAQVMTTPLARAMVNRDSRGRNDSLYPPFAVRLRVLRAKVSGSVTCPNLFEMGVQTRNAPLAASSLGPCRPGFCGPGPRCG